MGQQEIFQNRIVLSANLLDEKGSWTHSIYEAFQVFDKDAQ